jgi:hypothetical protein
MGSMRLVLALPEHLLVLRRGRRHLPLPQLPVLLVPHAGRVLGALKGDRLEAGLDQGSAHAVGVDLNQEALPVWGPVMENIKKGCTLLSGDLHPHTTVVDTKL